MGHRIETIPTGSGISVDVLRWDLFDGTGVDAAITTRRGGVSTGPYASLDLALHVGDDATAVIENRRRAAATIGCALDQLVFCRQVHGRTVVRVDRRDRGRGTRSLTDGVPDTDALVTTDPDVGLVVLVADCVPIVLFDPVRRVLGAVHAGWRGTVAGVAQATVELMVEVGADPSTILAGIGPAIGPDRYEVGPDVVSEVRGDPDIDPDRVLRRSRTPDKSLLDLWTANHDLLIAAGVAADRVAVARAPTGDDGPFFSDRAARPCGRFAALARIVPPSVP